MNETFWNSPSFSIRNTDAGAIFIPKFEWFDWNNWTNIAKTISVTVEDFYLVANFSTACFISFMVMPKD